MTIEEILDRYTSEQVLSLYSREFLEDLLNRLGRGSVGLLADYSSYNGSTVNYNIYESGYVVDTDGTNKTVKIISINVPLSDTVIGGMVSADLLTIPVSQITRLPIYLEHTYTYINLTSQGSSAILNTGTPAIDQIDMSIGTIDISFNALLVNGVADEYLNINIKYYER